jgi:small subunit ribosomal protein S9
VTDFEHPEDEQREDEELAAAEEPVEEAEEPAPPAEEPVEEAAEPAAEAEEAAEPAAAAEEPVAEAEEPVAEPEQPAETAEAVAEEEEVEEEELAPRAKPEIPGADLIPDIIPEGEEFLDAEAQAAAEAEAEAAAAAAAQTDQEEAQPIADAAIDLAAGARYTATGKRKTAVARVILKPGSGTYAINDKPLETFFPRETLQRMIRQPLEAVGYDSRMDVVARMHGGGVSAQAGALRHGISRALIVADPHLRGELKRRGFLTRDPRVKERKKAGLKKARKRPQFSKR